MVIGMKKHGRRHEKTRRWNSISTAVEILNDGLRNLRRCPSFFSLPYVVNELASV